MLCMFVSRFFPLFWPPIVVLGLHVLRCLVIPEANRLDMLAHFLGGASIALVTWKAISFLQTQRLLSTVSAGLRWYLCVATAELAGVLWEFWEFYLQRFLLPFPLSLEDTILDLVLDLSGALVLTTCLSLWYRRDTVDSSIKSH